MEYPLDRLCELVARHAPAFHLHHKDVFMPCTVEFFMQHSQLMVARPSSSGEQRTVLLPRGAVCGEALLELQRAHPRPARLWLELDTAARKGFPQGQINDVPLYAHVKEIVHLKAAQAGGGSSAVEALEINYLTFYAYNGHYNVGGVRLIKTGAHDGDWEHITARVHPATGELLGMWYNAHRSRDGMWVEGRRVPRLPDGRPLAYVALHGHGVYPMAGTIPRHFFLGNDKCSGRGPLWAPHTVVLLPPLHEEDSEQQQGQQQQQQQQQPWQGSGGSVRLDQAPPASPDAQAEGLAEALAADCSAAGTDCTGVGLDAGSGEAGVQCPAVDEQASDLAAQLAAARLEDSAVVSTEQQAASGSSRESGALGAATAAGLEVDLAAGNEEAGLACLLPPQELPSRPQHRRLHSAHSRGSSIGDGSGSTAAATGLAGLDCAAGAAAGRRGVRVVADDPCRWLFFRGQWGQTDAPICQSWFQTAEPPLSRTTLLRLFGHLWPEKDRI